jgi:hypothetical protein
MTTQSLNTKEIGAHAYLAEWTGLANGDDGVPFKAAGAADRSIQFGGTFGAGGNVVLEGSNDGASWFTLTDPQGNALSASAAVLEAVSEVTIYVRPRVSAGDGTTSISAYLLAKS